MPIRVTRKKNEPLEKLLKRFKKKCENADLIKDFRKNEYHETKSVRKRRERRKMLKRVEKDRKDEERNWRHRR